MASELGAPTRERRTGRLALALCVAALVELGLPGPSRAQVGEDVARAAARELGYEGVADFEAGRFEDARSKLERAYAVVRLPTLALWSARALVKRGELVAAAERYQEAVGLPVDGPTVDREVQLAARADAASEREALLPRIPGLVVAFATGPGAVDASRRLTIDGKPLAPALLGVRLPLDPGRHVLEVDDRGRVDRREIHLVEGQTLAVRLAARAPAAAATPARPPVAPPEQPTGDARRTAAAVALAGGGACLAFGAVFGVLAAGTWSDAEAACPGKTRCPDDRGRDLSREASTQAAVSTGAILVGAAALATSAILWITARPASSARALDPAGRWRF